MAIFYISVGSNTENKEMKVTEGISSLQQTFPTGFESSALYETRCAGGHGPDYSNAVVKIFSDKSLDSLNDLLKEMEISAGRDKANRESVALDLDIVIADNEIIREKDFSREYFKIGYNHLLGTPIDPKSLEISDFVYSLPEERIALHPLQERDNCKLLIGNSSGVVAEDKFRNLTSYLAPDSLLVYNNTRVINARLRFRKSSGALIEIFCLEPDTPSDYQMNFASFGPVRWRCFVGNSKRWKEGELVLPLKYGDREVNLIAKRIAKMEADSIIEFSWDDKDETFARIIEKAGEIPIPPYLNRSTEETDQTDYQTVFSRIEGSVAAPTAGLHFTPSLLEEIDKKGLGRREVTLHVGAGTFQPVKSDKVGEHPMHAEFIVVDGELIKELAETDKSVIAVGTTSVRTLESLYHIGCLVKDDCWSGTLEQWYPYEASHPDYTVSESLSALVDMLERNGEKQLVASTRIIIAPGYRYRLVKQMITNFHQPGSTLLLLVSAMIGDAWRKIYEHALENDYRFLSYGDACLFSS